MIYEPFKVILKPIKRKKERKKDESQYWQFSKFLHELRSRKQIFRGLFCILSIIFGHMGLDQSYLLILFTKKKKVTHWYSHQTFLLTYAVMKIRVIRKRRIWTLMNIWKINIRKQSNAFSKTVHELGAWQVRTMLEIPTDSWWSPRACKFNSKNKEYPYVQCKLSIYRLR